jgi:peptidoglycan/xylan/chitin deacetylase (PgdA/CDA1 family)
VNHFEQWGKKALKQGLLYAKNYLPPLHADKLRPACAVVLQYHSVSPSHDLNADYINPGLSVTQKDFERQIEFLVRNYNVMTMDQLLTYVQTEQKGTKMALAVTFDDGYRDNYFYAFPILRAYNVPALFYLTTDCIDGGTYFWISELRYIILKSTKTRIRLDTLEEKYTLGSSNDRFRVIQDIKERMLSVPRAGREEIMSELRHQAGIKDTRPLNGTMLNWKDVEEMHQAGMSFGAHTLSHPSLPYIPFEEAKREILESKRVLEDHLDEKVKHFCYPNPGGLVNFNGELRRIVEEAGYSSAATSEPGYVKAGDDLLQLKRKGIYRVFSNLSDFYYWVEKEVLMEQWKKLAGLGHFSQSLSTRPL